MTIDTILEDDSWDAVDLPGLADRAFAATLGHLGLAPDAWEVALLGCDDARIAALNTEFRGKAQPTNVLSWPSEDRASATEGGAPEAPDPTDPELGDIAIAYETCAREAATAGKPLADHALHLVVHGLLHLLGYDHVRDGDAALMEGLEVAILGKMGLADPYWDKDAEPGP